MTRGTLSPNQMPADLRSAQIVEYERYIDEQIGRTRGNVKAVELAGTLLSVTTAVSGFLLATAVLEHWVVPGGFGFWSRLLLLVILVSGAAHFLWHRAVPLLVRPINPVYAAHTIETSTPSLKNSLLNFLLLRRDQTGIAPAVYQVVEEQAATRLARVPVESAVDRSHLIRVGYVLLAVVVAACLYKVLSPKDPLVTARRVLLPWSDIQPPTRVRILDVRPADTIVAEGEQVHVSANVRGTRADDRVRLLYTTAGEQTVDQEIVMHVPAGHTRFSCPLPDNPAGILQDVHYRIEAGDAISRAFKIGVTSAPTIIVQRVDYDYPKYTGLVNQSVEREGDIAAIEGTRVTIHAHANGVIDSARVDFDCDGRSDRPMKSSGTTATASFTLALARPIGAQDATGDENQDRPPTSPLAAPADPRRTPEHASYQILFVNQAGHENRRPIQHRIDVTPDLPPEIVLLAPPEDELDLPLDGAVEFETHARDPDYALQKVLIRGSAGEPIVLDRSLLDRPHPGQFVNKFQFQPREYPLKVGDVVEIWAVAHDNRTPQANVRQTNRKRLRIVSPAEKQTGTQPDTQDGGPSRSDDSDGTDGQDRSESVDGDRERQDPSGGRESGDAAAGEDRAGDKDGEHGEHSKDSKDNESEKGGVEGEREKSGEDSKADKDDEHGERSEDSKDNESEKSGVEGEREKSGEDSKADKNGEHGERSEDSKDNESGKGGERGKSGLAGESSEGESDGRGGGRDGDQGMSPDGDGSQGGAAADGEAGASGQPSENSSGADQSVASDGSDDGGVFAEVLKRLQASEGRSERRSDETGRPESKPGSRANGIEKGGTRPGEAEASDAPGSRQPSEGRDNKGAAADQPQAEGAGNQTERTESPEGGRRGEGQGAADQPAESEGNRATSEQPSPSDANVDGPPRPKGSTEAGSDRGSQGSPESQTEIRPGDRALPPAGSKPAGNDQDARSPGHGQKESDSRGADAGDKPGQGRAGGGQQSDLEGTGSPGQSTAADDGSGRGPDAGSGDPTGNAGDDGPSDRPTGSAEGGQPGSGSGGRPLPPGEAPGSATPPESAASSQGAGAGGTAGGVGEPTGGGQAGDTSPPPPTSAAEPGGDKANLEYARKATNLVLQHLKDALSKDQVDRDLLDKLGWTRDDVQRFVDRWQKLHRDARGSEGEDGAAREELDQTLRSLGLGRTRVFRRGGSADDTTHHLRESARTSPPPAYQQQLKAYLRSTSRAAMPAGSAP